MSAKHRVVCSVAAACAMGLGLCTVCCSGDDQEDLFGLPSGGTSNDSGEQAGAGGEPGTGGGGVGGNAGTTAGGSGGLGGSGGSAGPGGQAGSGGPAGSGGDPCSGKDCTTPPPPSCADAHAVVTYASEGTCSEGDCVYPSSTSPCPAGQSCAGGSCACGTQGQWTSCVDSNYKFKSCNAYCASMGKCCVNTCQSPAGGQAGSWANWFTSACYQNDEGSVASQDCTNDDGWYGHFWFECCCA